MGSDAGNFLPLKINVTPVRSVEGGNDIEERRFACTIGADQPDDLPRLQGQIDVLQDLQAAEALTDSVQAENRMVMVHF